MSTQPTLFPESPEAAIMRLDQSILTLILGYPGGPLGLALDSEAKAVLGCIRYQRGLTNTITISDIQERTKFNVRQIKKAVRTLRLNYNLPIGSSKRGNDGGYYLMISQDDQTAWVKDVLDQVRAELAVLRAAAGPQVTLELLGQLQLEVKA